MIRFSGVFFFLCGILFVLGSSLRRYCVGYNKGYCCRLRRGLVGMRCVWNAGCKLRCSADGRLVGVGVAWCFR